MTEITETDRERARGVAVAIFGDHLPEGSKEFLAIAQALADARDGKDGHAAVIDPMRWDVAEMPAVDHPVSDAP